MDKAEPERTFRSVSVRKDGKWHKRELPKGTTEDEAREAGDNLKKALFSDTATA